MIIKIPGIQEFIKSAEKLGYIKTKIYYISNSMYRNICHFGSKISKVIYSIEDFDNIVEKQIDTVKVIQLTKLLSSHIFYTVSYSGDEDKEYKYRITAYPELFSGTIIGTEAFFNVLPNNKRLFKVSLFKEIVSIYSKYHKISEELGEIYLKEWTSQLLTLFAHTELFMNNVKIETNIAYRKRITNLKKRKKRINNKTNLDLVIVDSSWYTTLISVGESFVTGHWRNQPYGKEGRLRKLIYIKSHKRTAHIRRAKKLTDSIYQDEIL